MITNELTMFYATLKGFYICSDCGELYGRFWRSDEAHFQRCNYQCKRRQYQPIQPKPSSQDGRWDFVDFNAVKELCNSCGLEEIRSGSKWSLFFCEECKKSVCNLNEAARSCIIPIGRHSLMNGVAFSGKEAGDDIKIKQFFIDISGFFGRTGHLEKWQKKRMIHNLKAIGRTGLKDIGLEAYLNKVGEAGLKKSVALKGLFKHFGVEIAKETKRNSKMLPPLAVTFADNTLDAWDIDPEWILNSRTKLSGEPVFKFCYDPEKRTLWLGHGDQNHKEILNIRTGKTLDEVARGIYFKKKKTIYLRGHENESWLLKTAAMITSHGLPSDHRIIWGPKAAFLLADDLRGL